MKNESLQKKNLITYSGVRVIEREYVRLSDKDYALALSIVEEVRSSSKLFSNQ